MMLSLFELATAVMDRIGWGRVPLPFLIEEICKTAPAPPIDPKGLETVLKQQWRQDRRWEAIRDRIFTIENLRLEFIDLIGPMSPEARAWLINHLQEQADEPLVITVKP